MFRYRNISVPKCFGKQFIISVFYRNISVRIFNFGTFTQIYRNISLSLFQFRYRNLIFTEMKNVYRNMSNLYNFLSNYPIESRLSFTTNDKDFGIRTVKLEFRNYVKM